jgi:hypothetical protein
MRILASSHSQRDLHGDQTAENESHRMTDEIRFPRIYAMIKAAGHDSAKAAEILIDAQRKDAHARIWIKALAAARRSVEQ